MENATEVITEITPFGLLNDEECKVKFYIDKNYAGQIMGIHPNENTATLWIGYDDVVKIVKNHGNEVVEF